MNPILKGLHIDGKNISQQIFSHVSLAYSDPTLATVTADLSSPKWLKTDDNPMYAHIRITKTGSTTMFGIVRELAEEKEVHLTHVSNRTTLNDATVRVRRETNKIYHVI